MSILAHSSELPPTTGELPAPDTEDTYVALETLQGDSPVANGLPAVIVENTSDGFVIHRQSDNNGLTGELAVFMPRGRLLATTLDAYITAAGEQPETTAGLSTSKLMDQIGVIPDDRARLRPIIWKAIGGLCGANLLERLPASKKQHEVVMRLTTGLRITDSLGPKLTVVGPETTAIASEATVSMPVTQAAKAVHPANRPAGAAKAAVASPKPNLRVVPAEEATAAEVPKADQILGAIEPPVKTSAEDNGQLPVQKVPSQTETPKQKSLLESIVEYLQSDEPGTLDIPKLSPRSWALIYDTMNARKDAKSAPWRSRFQALQASQFN